MTNKSNIKNISKTPTGEIFPVSVNHSRNKFFSSNGVNKRKDRLLHERLETLIRNAGLSNQEFYRLLGVSRQYYFLFSYGLQRCPEHIKLKISKILQTDSSLIWTGKKLNSESDTNAS